MKRNVAELQYLIRIGPKEDLGTRAPMLGALAERMRRYRTHKAAQWIGDPHKTAAKRAELLAQVAYNPPPVPFRARTLGEERFPLFIRRTYRLRINPDDETEAFLFLPRNASRRTPVPVLLGLHEHGGQLLLGKVKLTCIKAMPRTFLRYQRMCYGGQPPADYFASNGFAVFVMDQFGFGSRAYWKNGEPPYHNARTSISAAEDLAIRLRMRYEHLWGHKALLAHGVSEAEITLYDNRRSIDFLEDIPELDASRLGAFGLSVGCMWTHHIAAFDPRVKASVRVCWSGDYGLMLERDGPRVLGTNFLLPRINSECHVAELVALSDPSAALILNGRRDSLYPWTAQEKTRKQIMRIAARQRRTQTLRWVYFDGPHCFHPPQQLEALQFFQKFLGNPLAAK
ncbi:MAG: hypothetical protein HY360_06225 [Verrucomicrobia bacterium]|nr:hypothetical protein [Verrucomicrobiota bacterium]